MKVEMSAEKKLRPVVRKIAFERPEFWTDITDEERDQAHVFIQQAWESPEDFERELWLLVETIIAGRRFARRGTFEVDGCEVDAWVELDHLPEPGPGAFVGKLANQLPCRARTLGVPCVLHVDGSSVDAFGDSSAGGVGTVSFELNVKLQR